MTAQNTLGVDGVQGIDPDMVARQIDAVFSDLRPDAVKIGMLYSRSIVEAVADRFCHWRPQNVVLDPVMISTSGSRLIEEDAVEAIKEKLFPFASLLTPNLMEAEHLTGIAIDGIAPAREAARCIVEKGCRAALVKGGHLDGDVAVDVLFGDGASFLALGLPLAEAVGCAKNYLHSALVAGAGVAVGGGHGPVNHLFNPNKLKTI